MAANLRERYAVGAEAMGFKRIETRSERYWVYRKPDWGFLFLGKAGAVRGGKTARVAMSFPLSPKTKEVMLSKADALEQKQPALI